MRKALNDVEEEARCFELAYRRYPNHPLLHTLNEQVIFRLEESSHKDRKSTYHFLLLSLCHVPNAEKHPSVRKISERLWEHCEWLDFVKINTTKLELPLNKDFLIIFLAFCLSQTYIVEETLLHLIHEKTEDRNIIKMGFLSLLYLNRRDLIVKIFQQEKESLQNEEVFCKALSELDPIKSLKTILKVDVDDILNQTAANYFIR